MTLLVLNNWAQVWDNIIFNTYLLCCESGFSEQIQSSPKSLPMLPVENGNVRHFKQLSVTEAERY